MRILEMSLDHLEGVLKIDHVSFRAVSRRTVENVNTLRESDPDGCYVALEGRKIVGFVFTKSMGGEGYLGPLAVLPDYQQRGIGTALIAWGLDYLKWRCHTIGLEVFPENNYNIRLYHKLDFVSGLPTLLFEVPKTPPDHHRFLEVTDLADASMARQATFLQDIGCWTEQKLQGANYTKDLSSTLEHGGNIVVAFTDRTIGFLAYAKSLLPFVWGAADNAPYETEVLKILLTSISNAVKSEKTFIEVNTKYQKAVKILIECNGKIRKSINRMLLQGYEGDQLQHSDDICMRPWIG